MENKTAKSRLILFLLLVILLPFLQHSFGFIDSGKLGGAMNAHPDIHFSPQAWWDGSYQAQKTLFLNDSVGFRPDLVRVNNQIDFSFFKKIQQSEIYAGHNGYLFSKDYVNEHEGRAYLGADAIRDVLIKLKLVQDTLERLGKTFIFTFAPSKAYCIPENIPDVLRRSGGPGISNYKTFKRISDSLRIKQIDYNALFSAMKDTSKYALFTRQGIHWSVYGSVLASDTLIKFIERERTIKMPELVITKMQASDIARAADDDLATYTNLIFPLKKEEYYYPEYHYSDDSTKTKPKTIFIGDSFVWLWIGDGFMQNTTKDWEYWIYFHEIMDQSGSKGFINNDYWTKKILETDCIVTVFATINLPNICSNTMFIESMYHYFYPDKK